jgi:hypothetical protein
MKNECKMKKKKNGKWVENNEQSKMNKTVDVDEKRNQKGRKVKRHNMLEIELAKKIKMLKKCWWSCNQK